MTQREPTPLEQLIKWVDGESECPNDRGECVPDFSCCNQRLQWPKAKRQAFVAADERTRERMLMGSLSSLLDDAGIDGHVIGGGR